METISLSVQFNFLYCLYFFLVFFSFLFCMFYQYILLMIQELDVGWMFLKKHVHIFDYSSIND